MSKQRLIKMTALMGAFTLLLSGCNNSDGLKDKVFAGTEWTKSVQPDSSNPVLSNSRFSLFLDQGMAVHIEDKKTNVIWSTNAASVTKADVVRDQFTLKYYDASGTVLQMGSKADSVDKNQAQAYLDGTNLYVKYRLGDFEKTVEDVPAALSNKRFLEKFIHKLDAAGQAEMREYYKYYEKDDAWKIKSKGKNNFKNILKIMGDVGYTGEDLKKDNAEFRIITDTSSKPYFTVVLKYSLGDDGLIVSAPSDYIEFSQNYPPYELTLLEGFGKQEQSSGGYILLPDGCGALMNFSRAYTGRSEISLPVYGLDLTQKSNILMDNKQDNEKVMLPVFGMKDGEDSYLAVLSGAESKAAIHACQAGTYYPRNAAYASFRLIDRDKVFMSGNDSHSATVLVFENKLFDGACTVEYHFLPKGSDYTDMAVVYRERLKKDGKLSGIPASNEKGIPLMVETLDGLTGYKNFMGISYTGVISMTSYKENQEMMSDFIKNGITNLDWKMTGWFNDGYYHDYIGKLKLQKELGNRKQWNDLLSFAKEKGVNLYPDVEFQVFSKGTLGFIPLIDASRGLDFSSVEIPVRSLAMQAENSGNGLTPVKLNVRSPGKLQQLTESFLKKYQRLNIDGISLRSSGTALYSDFNEKSTIDRTVSEEILIGHLKTVQKSVKNVMLNGSSEYALPFATAISEMPLQSSGFSLTSEDVPFLQTVLHGNLTLYGKAMNLTANSTQYLLKSIEYGVYLNYQLTACDSSKLKNTELTTNYSSNYSDWKKSILSSYSAVNQALSGVVNAQISGHRAVADQVYCTEYDNGIRVYVNYSGADVAVEGGVVRSMSYFVS